MSSERRSPPAAQQYSAAAAGERLDVELSRLSGVPRAQIRRWIETGRVRVDGELSRPSRRLAGGELLETLPPEPEPSLALPEPIELDIVYEDEHLVVVDKRAGMVVHPAPGHAHGTLVNALLHHCGDLAGVGGVLRPGIVHRLDKGTSGLIVVAKNDEAHAELAKQFHDHSIERRYRCFVRALPGAAEGRVDRPIGRHRTDGKRMSVKARQGREARTAWSVATRFRCSGVSELEVRPETGRTHQIRVHLASAGLPIVGDPVYGRARSEKGPAALSRPALHAELLGFVHPRSGKPMRFEAPLAEDMQALRAALAAREADG